MTGVGAGDELVIELSKTKALLMVLGSFGMVAAGYWLFSMDAEEMKGLPIDDPLFIHGVGIAGMVFFSLTGIFGIRKLFDKRPGLVLNSTGIIDNSSGLSAGFIPWSEITGAEIYEVHRQKMLMIKVKNPERVHPARQSIAAGHGESGLQNVRQPHRHHIQHPEDRLPAIAFDIRAISPEIRPEHESLYLVAC